MRIYAIGDLHLSFENKVIPGDWEKVSQYKPMSLFGDKWVEHYRKIYKNWKAEVTCKDLVLVPGDISWAMKLEEAVYDLEFIGSMTR